MSEELNLSRNLLNREELDVEAHLKKEGAAEESEDKGDEVEAHLLDNGLLLDDDNLLRL